MANDETSLDIEQLLKEAQQKAEQEENPQNSEQWVQHVEQALQEALSPERQQHFQHVIEGAKKALGEAPTTHEDRLGKQLHEFFEELDIKEVKKLLKQLEELSKSGAQASGKSPEEIVVFKRELEEVQREATRREATRRNVESGSIAAATRGSLEQQVFENFAQYLEEGAIIHYGGDRLEVHRAADGALIIQVPSPSFENMLALAGELGNLKEHYADNPEKYADMLMDAAIIMDYQSIYASDTIMALFNAGYKLKLLARKIADTGEAVSFQKIQALTHTEMGKPGWDKRFEEAFFNIFLGKEDPELELEDGKLRIKNTNQKPGQQTRKLYDVLFDQWQKWLVNDFAKDPLEKANRDKWLSEHGYTAAMLRDLANADDVITAFEEWILHGKKADGTSRREDLLRRMKHYMEQRVNPTGADTKKFGLLFSKWRHMLLDTKVAKSIKDDIEAGMAGRTEKEQLEFIARFFQPNPRNANEPTPALRFLPSEVLTLFQQNNATGERNDAACVITDSYVKSILEAQGFQVFTQLYVNEGGKSAHTRLIALKGGKAYYVDPNISKEGAPAVAELVDTNAKDREILQQLRTNPKNVVFHTQDHSVIADGNAILTSGFITNMIGTRDLPPDVQLAAAQKAVDLFKDNPVALFRLAQASKDDPKKQAEYLRQAQQLDPRITEESLHTNVRIGSWEKNAAHAPGPTHEFDPSTLPPELKAVIDKVNDEIRKGMEKFSPTVPYEEGDLSYLSEEWLIGENPATRRPDPRAAGKAEVELTKAFTDLGSPPAWKSFYDERIQELEEYRMRIWEAMNNRVSIFNLGQEEQLFLGMTNEKGIRGFVEKEILRFSKDFTPGAFLPRSTEQEIQSRLHDINTLLQARFTDNTYFKPEDKTEAIEFLRGVNEMFEGAPKASGLIESGNPKYQEAATENINQMDKEGGLRVLNLLSSIHGGRPVGLVSDIRREMKKTMQANFENTGSPFIVHEQYKELGNTVREMTIKNAMNGIGPYARFRQVNSNDSTPGADLLEDPQNPGDPDAALKYQEKKVREQVEMDVKFAQLIFTITGEASAIYIRGRLPDGTFDPGATSFLNATWQDAQRYGVITDANKAVAAHQFRNAAEYHLKELFEKYEGKAKDPTLTAAQRHSYHLAAEQIKMIIGTEGRSGKFRGGDEALRQSYIDMNAIDILAPQVNMWWENRFIRTMPMITSLNTYEKELSKIYGTTFVEPHWVKNMFPPGHPEKGYDIPIGGDPEFGIMLRAFLYEGSIFTMPEETERILHGKGTDYFPDVIFEPFAMQAGAGYKAENAPADQRFIAVFGGPAAAFLDALTPPGYTPGGYLDKCSDEYKLAMKRYDTFQKVIRPAMDAIRNQRINSIDAVTKKANPRQTNFAATTGLQSAVKEVDAALTALGVKNPNDFRKLIEAMQQQIRHHHMDHSLAFDPMFENQHYSPMTLIDVPSWMLDGKDLAGKEHKDPLRQKLGANNRLGRYIGDVAMLDAKTRAGLIQLLKANPNNTGQVFKIIEEMGQGISATRGIEQAHDVELMTGSTYLRMMHPKLADAMGFAHAHMSENTPYRKIYGKLINAMDREEIFSFVEGHVMPGLSKEHREKMRKILKITPWRRKLRKGYQTFFMLLISLLQQTFGTIFGVVNEGITKG